MKTLPRLLTGCVIMATGMLGTAVFAAPAMAVDLRETIAEVTETAPQPCQGGGNCCTNHPDKAACTTNCATNPSDPACQPGF